MSLLPGQMMQMPLMLSSLIVHAARHAGDVEVVSRRVEGDVHRCTYRDIEHRARCLAQALARLGYEPGERVATLAWNGYRHLEIYYGVAGAGLVCHTVNPRLFPDQIAWIVAHAQDRLLCFDLSFVALVESLLPQLGGVRHFVLMCDRDRMPASTTIPGLLCYEDLLAAEDGGYTWPQFDENTACSICYTSGTTGDPKGVVYSHRSSVLHAYALLMPSAMGVAPSDVVLMIVPMFHVNAWGLPYAVPGIGAKLVLPGPQLDGASLHALIEAEGVSFSAGVPTVWLGLIAHAQQHGLRFSTLRRTVVGGSALPPAMTRTLREAFDIEAIHAWGMTEISPLGTISRLRPQHLALDDEGRRRALEKQGAALFGVDMTIVDDDHRPLPWDGRSAGHLLVRGPWVVERYLGVETSPLIEVDGVDWFPTGDIATIDPVGMMQITDRSKDVIKSGGEWISSIELENIAVGHPAVREAAVIGCAHPKWTERPLLVVVAKPGTAPSREDLLGWFEGRIAKWQIPDDVVFVDELPHTATGKLQKRRLREQLADYRWPGL